MMRVVVAAGEPGGAPNTLRVYSCTGDGVLSPLGPATAAGIQNMYCATYQQPSTGRTFLYSVDINCAKDPVRGREAEGLIKAWQVENTGGLSLINTVATGGEAACLSSII